MAREGTNVAGEPQFNAFAMTIQYGRTLPKGPRPKAPQPKLGDLGPRRFIAKKKKNKKSADNGGHLKEGRQTAATTKSPEKDSKQSHPKSPTRQKDKTPIKATCGTPRAAIGQKLTRPSRVVVIWSRKGQRYMAWGALGVKSVEGWKECTSEVAYKTLLNKLGPIGTKLKVTDDRLPVAELLDLMIMGGKIIKANSPRFLAPKHEADPARRQRTVKNKNSRAQAPHQTHSENRATKPSRVVVIWRRKSKRYMAWGTLGIKSVEGWKECTSESAFNSLLKKLGPIGTRLTVPGSHWNASEFLDLIIMGGKIINSHPPAVFASSAKSGSAGRNLHQAIRIKWSKARLRRRSDSYVDLARHEALVIRPSGENGSTASRRQKSANQKVNNERKRKQMLARQRRELKRLQWYRKNGYEEREAPDDLMHRALQGGAPGLKR